MSVLEEISSLEKHVLARLRELEPSVAEYRELQQAAERLGLDYDANGASKAARQPQPARATRRRATAKRSRSRTKRGVRPTSVSPGVRDRQVLEAVGTQPGITVPELGKLIGIDYTGLYRVTRRLEAAGQIRKTGARLELQD